MSLLDEENKILEDLDKELRTCEVINLENYIYVYYKKLQIAAINKRKYLSHFKEYNHVSYYKELDTIVIEGVDKDGENIQESFYKVTGIILI